MKGIKRLDEIDILKSFGIILMIMAHIGGLIKDKINCLNVKSIVFVLLGSILTFVNGYISVRQGIYSNIVLYYIVALLMTIGLYVVSKQIKKDDNVLISELKFIDKNSLIYVCLNQLFLLVLNKLGELLVTNILFLTGYKIVELLVVFVILHISVYFFNTRKVR